MRTKISLFIFSLLSLCIFSCSSVGFEDTANLTGRVCDVNGNPVSGYVLSFGFGENAITNSNGIFSISGMKSGSYKITGYKKDWTSIEENIEFIDRRSFFVIQVNPISTAFSEIEELLRVGDYTAASKIIKREGKGNSSNSSFEFYKNLVDYCLISKKNPTKANSIKKKMEEILLHEEKIKEKNK